MSIGLNPTKAEIDSTIGNLARQVQEHFARVTTIKFYLDGTLDAELIAKGYLQAEVNTIKSAFTDLAQLNTLYIGGATLGVAKDFRAFTKLLWGLGV